MSQGIDFNVASWKLSVVSKAPCSSKGVRLPYQICSSSKTEVCFCSRKPRSKMPPFYTFLRSCIMCRRRQGEHRDEVCLGFLDHLPVKKAECSQITVWTLRPCLSLKCFLMFPLSTCLVRCVCTFDIREFSTTNCYLYTKRNHFSLS